MPTGVQALRVAQDNGAWNLHHLSFAQLSTPYADGYRSDGVNLEATGDTQDTTGSGAPYDLGFTGTGQWTKYTVSLRVASPAGVTDGLHLANSAGLNVSGDVNVPDTGGWQNWTTVTANVNLPFAGPQTLTLDQDNGGWNVHSLTFAG